MLIYTVGICTSIRCTNAPKCTLLSQFYIMNLKFDHLDRILRWPTRNFISSVNPPCSFTKLPLVNKKDTDY